MLFWFVCAEAFAQVTNDPKKSLEGIITASASYILDDKHQLEAGDRISFQILEDRSPAKTLIVADSRELDVPYIGRVAVKEKTCMQLAKELKVLLEKEYYYRATVIVGLDALNKVRGKIYIWGQVHTQGSIDLLFGENLTAGKAILRAGGFSNFANKKKVKVIRNSTGQVGDKMDFEINMVDVLENGKTDKDVVLEPDDFIMVPARLVNF